MKRTTALLAAIVLGAAGSAYALYSVSDTGAWPKSWPAELEPLRKQSRTLVGSLIAQQHHEIPFAQREAFESAWPQLLKVKSQGAPVILLRAPDTWLGETIKAGVRIHAPPPGQSDNPNTPEAPINSPNVRERWMYTTFIELVVDGAIVDLNRIPLPADTPIVDERFKDRPNQSPQPAGE